MKIKVRQVAALLGKSEMFVRIGMQRNLLPIGTAIMLKGNKYTYNIIPGQLAEYLRIAPSELERKLASI